MADIATLGIRITTQGAAQSAADLRKLETQAAATERSAVRAGTNIGRYLGAGLALAVGGGIAAVIRNTIAAEKSQAQLAAVLKSTGGAAGLNARELNKMADAMQGLSTFDDEAITGAQSLLLTFTRIGKDAFPQATQAVLDMSTAMGTDLKSAALQVGKALNDPAKGMAALARSGIQFTDAQEKMVKEMTKVGDVAGAQTIILRELETQFGGSAAAARNTLGGALQGLKNDFDNLLEGDSGDAGIVGATDAVNDLGEMMRSPEVRAGFAEIVSGIAQVTKFALEGIAAVAGLGQAVADAFRANQDKTALGLLQRRFELESRLARLRDGQKNMGVNRALLAASRVGLGPDIAELQGELNGVNAILKQRAALARQVPRGGGFPLDGTITIHGGAPTGGGGGGRSSAARDAAAAMRELAADEKRLMDQMRETAQERERAIEQFGSMAATLSGPLAAAEFDHLRRLADITEVGREAGKTSEEIARVKALEVKRYEEETAAIRARKGPAEEMLDNLRFELSLLDKGNVARQTAIQLRGMDAESVREYGNAIAEANRQIAAEQEKIGAMDDFRASFTDAFASVIDGSKSAADAFKDFADSIVSQIARIIAQQAAASLFGAPGTSQTGSAGGIVQSLFGALFGGGRALGGPVSAGRLYEVGEGGKPEFFNAGGKQYLIPGSDGHVTPAAAGRGMGPVSITMHFAGPVSRENATYAANKMAQKLRHSARSN